MSAPGSSARRWSTDRVDRVSLGTVGLCLPLTRTGFPVNTSRRQFLTYLGVGSYALLRNPLGAAERAALPRRRAEPPSFFKPISASRKDELLLPEGYRFDILAAWDDLLGSTGPHGPERFGFNNDFLAYFSIDALTGGTRSDEGLLWVNHEYPNGLFVGGHRGPGKKSAECVKAEKLSVGGSVIQVYREEGTWKRRAESKYARRLTALYPEIGADGPAGREITPAIGTYANCAGGQTPWHTALSCEEAYDEPNNPGGWAWCSAPGGAVDETCYGWVVEVDPFGQLPPVKHTALGRFMHENASVRLGPTGRVVVYMGDDAPDQFLYKYVSAGTYDAKASRATNQKLLAEGTLYAADFRDGRWLPLDVTRSRALRAAGFKTQADVMTRTRQAAKLLGATPVDRTEDTEIHPRDGSLYVAMTGNPGHGNFYGQLVRLVEERDDPEGEAFQFEIFLTGGPQCGLAYPDNLAFDRDCNLWVCSDVSSSDLKKEKGAYAKFGNNGVWVVPTAGAAAGDAFQFVSGPVDCELTGPWFSPDGSTLFLSVQHPGESTKDPAKPTSHWPTGTGWPRPAVVAITGFPKWS